MQMDVLLRNGKIRDSSPDLFSGKSEEKKDVRPVFMLDSFEFGFQKI